MEHTRRFINRHVLITGAARGIGFEIARQFAREGAVLSLLDFNQDNLTSAVKNCRELPLRYMLIMWMWPFNKWFKLR